MSPPPAGAVAERPTARARRAAARTAAAAAAAAHVTRPVREAPRRAPAKPRRKPRRYSGPAAGPRWGSTGAAALPAPRPVRLPPRVRRAAGAISALPDRRVVDRLVRGPGWIVLIGALLIGLVALQVSMLSTNAQIGRDSERAAALERANTSLEATIAQLSSAQRIQARGQAMGLTMPAAEDVRWTHTRASDVRTAAAGLRDAAGSVGATGTGASTAGDGASDESPDTILSDGDPSNDYLADGDPTNDDPGTVASGDGSSDGGDSIGG